MFWRKKKNKATDNVGAVLPAATIKVVIKTDLGKIRTNNEDSACFFQLQENNTRPLKGSLLMVADGMGGHLAGEVASRMAVDTIREEYFKQDNYANKLKLLEKAFQAANKKIFELASSNANYKGMGTTCTAILIEGKTIFSAHVGDSRAYLFKNDALIRLTEDHTYVRELVKNGDISKAEAETHPQRNILTNAMGTKATMQLDTNQINTSFDTGDRLMICSDGLYDYLNDEEIAEALKNTSLDDTANYFIAEARLRGGKDNITVALAEQITASNENRSRETKDNDLPVMTRDVDIPTGLNNS